MIVKFYKVWFYFSYQRIITNKKETLMNCLKIRFACVVLVILSFVACDGALKAWRCVRFVGRMLYPDFLIQTMSNLIVTMLS